MVLLEHIGLFGNNRIQMNLESSDNIFSSVQSFVEH